MSHLYWNTPLLSPFLVVSSMNSGKSLKRSRSTESIEKALKRSKPFQSNTASNEASPISSTSSTHSSLPIPYLTETPISSDVNQSLYPVQQPVLKPICISTKTFSPSETPQSFISTNQSSQLDYRHVNDMLYSIHVERFGDPEERESWWENDSMDIDNEEIQSSDTANEYYAASNSTLRQAFLERHLQQRQ